MKCQMCIREATARQALTICLAQPVRSARRLHSRVCDASGRSVGTEVQGGALDEIIPKPIPLPNPEPHPRSNRRSLRKLRTAVVECRRQRLKRRRRRSRVVELHRSIHAVSRASGEPWHRAKAAMLVADCASEALTTEDERRRERSGVQCEAQASLSAL